MARKRLSMTIFPNNISVMKNTEDSGPIVLMQSYIIVFQLSPIKISKIVIAEAPKVSKLALGETPSGLGKLVVESNLSYPAKNCIPRRE